MDPDACVERVISAMNDGDYEEARFAFEDIFEWLRRGGFAPRGPMLDKLQVNTRGDMPDDIQTSSLRLCQMFP